jgi:hypothetical protein
MAMTMDACVAMTIIGALLENESRILPRSEVLSQVQKVAGRCDHGPWALRCTGNGEAKYLQRRIQSTEKNYRYKFRDGIISYVIFALIYAFTFAIDKVI